MSAADPLFDMLREEVTAHVVTLRSRLSEAPETEHTTSIDSALFAVTSIQGALRVTGLQELECAAVALDRVLREGVHVHTELHGAALGAINLFERIAGAGNSKAARALLDDALRCAAALGSPIDDVSVPAPAIVADVSPATLELYAQECETNCATLNDGLLILEREPTRTDLFDRLMRASHSLKGAARAVGFEPVVRLAHEMESVLTRAMRGNFELDTDVLQLLLSGTDAIARVGTERRMGAPDELARVTELIRASAQTFRSAASAEELALAPTVDVVARSQTPLPQITVGTEGDRILRVRASHISKMVGLAGEAMVESRRLRPLWDSQNRLRIQQAGIANLLNDLHQRLGAPSVEDPVGAQIAQLRSSIGDYRATLLRWEKEFDEHARRAEELNFRLFGEASKSRLRPLNDGLLTFPRMIRDLARRLGKFAHLAVSGEHVLIDRDILEKIEAPLTHLLRNSVDHGIESTEERTRAGKPEAGQITLSARTRAGTLDIEISDDGRGIDPVQIRERVITQGLLPEADAAQLPPQQLFDYLFAPGFTTAKAVTDISGRGVGLDVVLSVLHEIGGAIHVTSEIGAGTTFHLTLPISRSVLRAVVVHAGGEAYAFPLGRVDRLLAVSASDTHLVDDRQYILVDGRAVALVRTAQILELGDQPSPSENLNVVVVSDRNHRFGFVVDRFLGEEDLVVQPLDLRIGRVADINAAAILPDGSPVLIIDVDDLIRSVVRLQQVVRLDLITTSSQSDESWRRRILIVDDSVSVRELVSRLLIARGYDVDVATDGHEGWSMVRDGRYGLVIADVDMPRMDGIALTRSIKQDARLQKTPVLIVSYRDSPEDQLRGVEAGADGYLTKTNFGDDALVRIVASLIGEGVAASRDSARREVHV